MGLTLKPFLRLLPLLWLACSSVALAQYVPSATRLRSADTFHVKQDGQFTQTLESLLRIDTPQEALYYQHGGILNFVVRQLLESKRQ